MGRTLQETLRIERRRTQVAELYLKGGTQSAIAKELGVSQATVSADLKVIRKEWKESRIRDFGDMIDEELRKQDLLGHEAWKGWLRSQQPVETTRIIQHKGDVKAEKIIRQQTGDPRFLLVVQRAMEMRCKLLGLDKQANAALDGHIDELVQKEATRLMWGMVQATVVSSANEAEDPIEARIAAEAKSLKSEGIGTSQCPHPESDGGSRTEGLQAAG